MGCKFTILKGIHVSFALLTLGFVTIILWPWKNNFSTFLLAQQRFRHPSSDVLLNAPNISQSSRGHTEVNKPIFKKEAPMTRERHNPSSSTKSVTTFTSDVEDSDEEVLSAQNAG
ncbi:hypothetical protein F3Y22_tig00112231pilonHSYRG00116 [Hibiscus syriacus]|uniref:Uncharacterized protein n=1 Tax=Hibiscus syriacus TaxID=106335 RepID=A0A6A2Y7W0_HIBSY|nr:hypothetical protein F3Y22_tig00112231pilonHSYRG00116 [Hibiscus syriacus]